MQVAGAGASNMVVNNLWGTNYVMWNPYRIHGEDVASEANTAFRYALTFS